MSMWTHVVGCIRVDGIPVLGASSVDKLRATIGPMCLFDEWDDSSRLPRGSEGSLQYEIIEYDGGMPWVAIPIWGDLRDFGVEGFPGVEKWWKETLSSLKHIRDAVLLIQAESGEQIILKHESPEREK